MLSRNTEAVLLLTAPLILKKSDPDVRLLTPGEYNKLAMVVKDAGAQPADLLAADASTLVQACESALGLSLEPLLGRGFRLASAVEQWQSRSIWVYSRSDAEYPVKLKQRLKQLAPPLLYGCGRLPLPENPGLAVVGSRDASEERLNLAAGAGSLAARAGYTLVSGGARGVDKAAMQGALEAEGNVIGALADSLQRQSLAGDTREPLANGRLVLLSPFDPLAGFHVGNAMARNKVIYALADGALVVNADYKKGGTWEGAIEQLRKPDHIPIFVRRPGPDDRGLQALVEKGTRIWDDPSTPAELHALLAAPAPVPAPRVEQGAFALD
jgi:predicted Rossmann fold nucleotide-binding protein DprA/Smf involved in DNA uptake